MDDCSPDDMGRVTNVYGEDSGADDCEGRLYNEVLSLRRQLEEQKKVTETVKGLAVLEVSDNCTSEGYHSAVSPDQDDPGAVHPTSVTPSIVTEPALMPPTKTFSTPSAIEESFPES
ncbi:unnamed protein product [Calicophoron daubneyi]|uniref:Uncharacterized protein n=1 Tax=Calicophoron daubneyi TaxID=300641 RepID=A0AAV2TS87_CALDB